MWLTASNDYPPTFLYTSTYIYIYLRLCPPLDQSAWPAPSSSIKKIPNSIEINIYIISTKLKTDYLLTEPRVTSPPGPADSVKSLLAVVKLKFFDSKCERTLKKLKTNCKQGKTNFEQNHSLQYRVYVPQDKLLGQRTGEIFIPFSRVKKLKQSYFSWDSQHYIKSAIKRTFKLFISISNTSTYENI